jgi:hypothetical protein
MQCLQSFLEPASRACSCAFSAGHFFGPCLSLRLPEVSSMTSSGWMGKVENIRSFGDCKSHLMMLPWQYHGLHDCGMMGCSTVLGEGKLVCIDEGRAQACMVLQSLPQTCYLFLGKWQLEVEVWACVHDLRSMTFESANGIIKYSQVVCLCMKGCWQSGPLPPSLSRVCRQGLGALLLPSLDELSSQLYWM